MKTAKQLKKGDTEQFKKDSEVIQLYFMNGRYFIEHKRPNGLKSLESFNSLSEARSSFKARVKHIKTRVELVETQTYANGVPNNIRCPANDYLNPKKVSR